MSDNFHEAILNEIMKAQREAAELIHHAKGVLTQCKTGHRDVVTDYDKKIQALLIERLSSFLPGAGFFCEEGHERADLKGEHVFIIDPIDGTMNFVRGFNHSCISVAYSHYGEIMAAAVYNPYQDEMFTAISGRGAFLNGRRIKVSDQPLSESIVCCGTSPYRPDLKDQTFGMMEKAFAASLDIRREGSAELDLCSAAAGRAGAFFELSVYYWDYAAGYLLVKEAGGVLSDIKGNPLPFNESRTSIIAGGRQAAEELTAILNDN